MGTLLLGRVVVAFRAVEKADVGNLVVVDANLVEVVLGHQAACYCQSLADNLLMYRALLAK